MQVFRITAPAYAGSALSGEGAARTGARWNSVGTRIGYTAGSRSLAVLEMLVHVDRDQVPVGRRLLGFEIPDDAIEPLHDWPRGWNRLPYSPAVRAVGDAWAASKRSLALRVPSAIVAGEFNVLVNPAHPRFAEVARRSDEPLVLDLRLFGA